MSKDVAAGQRGVIEGFIDQTFAKLREDCGNIKTSTAKTADFFVKQCADQSKICHLRIGLKIVAQVAGSRIQSLF